MRIVFVVNVDWFFISHRLPLALEAKRKGWEVFVISGDTGKGRVLEKYGINFIPWDLTRSGTNVFYEIKALISLFILYRKIKPHLVHNIGIKAVIYSSLVAKNLKLPYINAIAGLGFSFGNFGKAKLIKKIISIFFRHIFSSKKSLLILQNTDDKNLFIKQNYCSLSQINLIRGSGVDFTKFKFTNEPKINGNVKVCLPSRMLWDKGVGEFIDSIRILKRKREKLNATFILIGGLDLENPAFIPRASIEEWIKEGLIEWWGHLEDMSKALELINIVVLPSYNEGLPKVLIEASAKGRAIITTDVPGCREIIKNNVNGLVVPSKDSSKLSDAILYLIENPNERERLIKNALEIGLNEYQIDNVIKNTFELYDNVLNLK